MEINLDKEYRLITDEYQFILQKVKTKGEKAKDTGKVYYEIIGFYGTLEQALNGYVRHCLLESKATTIQELLEELKNLHEYIKEITT